jgi:hypothetical protein
MSWWKPPLRRCIDLPRRVDWRPLLIAACGLFLLLPARDTGWVGDDALNSSLRGAWIYHNSSLLRGTLDEIHYWAFTVGRVNPLIYLWKNVTFAYLYDLYWYKWAQVAAVLVSLLVFYGCLRGMRADADFAALCCLLAAGLIQFRTLADPVLAFNGLLPLLLVLTALSVLLLYRHGLTGSPWPLAGSLLFYAAAILTYEMTYVFWALHAWVLVRTRPGWRRGARTLLPFVGLPVLLGLASVTLRSVLTANAVRYNPQLHLPGMADTFLKQLLAAWPCSSAGLDPTFPVQGLLAWQTFADHPGLLAVASLLAWHFAARLIRRAREGGLRLAWWAGLGLLLAVLPVPVLCACEKYQAAFHYGFGYLPVYVEYFGVALLLAAGIGWLGCRLRRCPARLLALPPALCCAACTVVHYAGNEGVVAALREPYLSPRCEIEEVISEGLLAAASPGGVLVADPLPWEPPTWGGTYFYSWHTNTPLLSPPRGNPLIRRRLPAGPCDRPPQDLLRLRYFYAGGPGNFALAGRLHYARLDPDGRPSESGVSAVRLAVWRAGSDDPQPDPPFVFHSCCWYEDADGAHRAERIDLPSDLLRPVRVTPHWTIYEVASPYPYLDAEAAWLEFPDAPRYEDSEVEEVVEKGLLAGPSADSLVLADPMPWGVGPGGAYHYPCRAVTLPVRHRGVRRGLPALPCDRPRQGLLRLRCYNTGRPGSFALAGRLHYARFDPAGTLPESGVSAVRLAVWRGEPDDPLRDRPFVFHSCHWHTEAGGARRAERIDLPVDKLSRLRLTPHWAVYAVDAPYPNLDAEAAWLEFPPAGR